MFTIFTREYLYQLHKSLVELCSDSKDDHVYDLQRKVALLEESEATVERNHNRMRMDKEERK